jgi:signal transduction histidine kinase
MISVQDRAHEPPSPSSQAFPALRRWFAALVDRFVPEASRADADQVRRARLLVGFSFINVPVGATFCALAVFNYGIPRIALVAAMATLTAALTPPLLKRTGSMALATSGMLAVNVACMMVASASIDGQAALTLPWLAAIPLLATMLAGRAAGGFWALTCVVVTVAYYALDGAAWLPPKVVLSADAVRTGGAWNVAIFILFTLSFAILYESLRLTTTAALADAQRRLEVARDQSLRADRLASLGHMAAGVAHEINNPMTFVSSNIELLHEELARGILDPASRREYVEDILPATREGLGRVIRIVADLRRFACGDSQEGVELDLNQEVQSALRLCEGELSACRLTVKLGELPRIVGRPSEVLQVAMNLVVNAAQAVQQGGEVRVETESTGHEIVLRVTDDGVGMTAHVKAHLFEPFFTTKPLGEGTGLGLSVVHGIVQAHGGSVHVHSELACGSTFEVRLPTVTPLSLLAE